MWTTYATDEIIPDRVAEVTLYRQASGMSEMEFAEMFWTKALRCGNVLTDRNLKEIFVEGLLSAIRSKVRNYLTSHPNIGYDALVRYPESYGDTHRVSRRQSVRVDTQKPTARKGSSRTARKVHTIDTQSESIYSVSDEDQEHVLALSCAFSMPSSPTTLSASTPAQSVRSNVSSASSRAQQPHGQAPVTPCRIYLSREPNCCQLLLPDLK